MKQPEAKRTPMAIPEGEMVEIEQRLRWFVFRAECSEPARYCSTYQAWCDIERLLNTIRALENRCIDAEVHLELEMYK